MFTHAKKHRTLRQAFAFVLSLALFMSTFSLGAVQAESNSNGNSSVTAAITKAPEGGDNTYVLDTTKDLEAVAQGSKADGDTVKAGTDDYFTVIFSEKTKVDGSDKNFDDGYTASQRFNMGGKTAIGDVTKNAVMFETGSAATVKVWWVSGGDGRELDIFNGSGTSVTRSAVGSVKNSLYISEFSLTDAGKYFLGSSDGSNYIFKVEVAEAAAASAEYVLDTTKDLEAVAQGSKADGDTVKAGSESFFTVIFSEKSKVDGSDKNFDDGYTASQRFNMGGKTVIGDVTKNAVMFEVDNAATVKVWWVSGGDGRELDIFNSAGSSVTRSSVGSVKNSLYISEFSLEEAGKYYLGSADGSNYIFKVQVTVNGGGEARPPRADWAGVQAPSVTKAVAGKEGTIDVTVSANVGYDGADEVVITMLDASGKEIESLKSIAEQKVHTRSFTPDASGTYTFTATISREGEESKAATGTKSVDFVLPLGTPNVSGASCLGGGKIKIVWGEVAEAEKYIVSANGTDISVESTELSAELSGLTIDQTYTFSVKAVRGTETSDAGTIEWKVVDMVQRTWNFAAFGASTNTTNNLASGSVYENNLVVETNGGKGKLQPTSNDGVAFYYTTIDPETENFTLSADITVDEWTYSNAQEGFGIMAADSVGEHGDSSTFWNNSYMAVVSKVEYYWDSATNSVVDSGGTKYSMKLGVGAQAKTGVTAEDIASGVAMPENFASVMYPLETLAASSGMGAGTYNVAANYTNDTGSKDVPNLQTTFHMEIQRNNTGYFVSYTDESGNTTLQKFYHANDGDELLRIDPDNIYVGFFTARNAKISISNIELTTVNPADDAPAEERPMTTVTPNYVIESGNIANSENYEIVYYGNADGTLTVTGPEGVVADAVAVTANTKYRVTTNLDKGENTFHVTFTPNADYKPSEYEVLESYDAVEFDHVVEFKVNEGDIVYVSPTGTDEGVGTKEDPMSIQKALAYAAPGQGIFLMEGTYTLNDKLSVNRGINGTEDKMIYLVADPEAVTRPVLDFNKTGGGITIGGDYWYLQGFDVTNSANGQKGLQISGDYCTVDQVNAYRNGNTGIQISRFKSSDIMEDWPSNNLILNCTSYLNADAGYEDADGFAAKLTVGQGNVFDGCIAAYNADDGWDLYAKPETGPIGRVTVQNSIAFKNGYDIDESGNVIEAGNGNGFKLGGSSISGYHLLKNSIAFANKSKGIDSNSCPDVEAINCTTFNNGSYNIAFYTNDAANTDFYASGIVSYQNDGNTTGEQLKLVGTQNQDDIYNDTNYYFNGSASANKSGATVAEDWFVSLDTDAAINGGITRNEDGTINMNGYLELTDKAACDAGARMTGMASLDMSTVTFSTASGSSMAWLPIAIIAGVAGVGAVAFALKRKKGA